MAYAQIRQITVQENGRLELEGLPVRAGDRVEVVVIHRDRVDKNSARYPLRGQPLRYEGPFEPAAPPDEWEANR